MKNKAAVELGKRGGEKTREKHGGEYFKKISKLGVEARKRRKSEAKDVLDKPTA